MISRRIVFVHGFWDSYRIFSWMASYLKRKDWIIYNRLNLKPNTAKYGLEKQAEQLAEYIQKNIPEDERFQLIAFSMGGLVSRYYIQMLGGHERVDKLITIATPHHGTLAAYLFKYKGCIQMRPGSEFLQHLNSDLSLLEKIQVTSIWAKFDTTIIPNLSSRLPMGREVILPFGIHPFIPFYRKVILEVERALDL